MKTIVSKLIVIAAISFVMMSCQKSTVQPTTITKTVTDTIKSTKTDTVYESITPPSIYGQWTIYKQTQQVGSGNPYIINYTNSYIIFGVNSFIMYIGGNTNQGPATYGTNTCVLNPVANEFDSYTFTWDYHNQQYLMTNITGSTVNTFYLKQ